MSGRARAAKARVGFDAPFEPFAWIENGSPRGMLIELVTAVLDAAGQARELVPLELDFSERALITGVVDALAFKGITPERCEVLAFSDPLIVSGAAAFTRPGLPPSFSLGDFAGLTLATPRHGPLAARIERDHPEINILRVASYRESFDAVGLGRADLAVLNFHAGRRMAQSQYPGRFNLPDAPSIPVTLALATSKSRTMSWLARFNAALARLHAEGTAQRIISRWSMAQ